MFQPNRTADATHAFHFCGPSKEAQVKRGISAEVTDMDIVLRRDAEHTMSTDSLGTAGSLRHKSLMAALFGGANVIVERVRAFRAATECRRRAHTKRRLLKSMPDRMLNDIGVCRSEVDFVFSRGRFVDQDRAASSRNQTVPVKTVHIPAE